MLHSQSRPVLSLSLWLKTSRELTTTELQSIPVADRRICVRTTERSRPNQWVKGRSLLTLGVFCLTRFNLKVGLLPMTLQNTECSEHRMYTGCGCPHGGHFTFARKLFLTFLCMFSESVSRSEHFPQSSAGEPLFG